MKVISSALRSQTFKISIRIRRKLSLQLPRLEVELLEEAEQQQQQLIKTHTEMICLISQVIVIRISLALEGMI